MKTRKLKNIRNKTTKKTKKTVVKLKILHKNYQLYAAKSFQGSEILQYNREQERIHNDSCLMENISWFGDLKVAKSYKTKDNNIYCWKTIKTVKLFDIVLKNENFLEKIFNNKNIKLIPSIQINKKINYEHPYLNMDNNEKALFEFKFAFGYLSLTEQYLFMKLIEFLITKENYDMKRRDGKSIINKLKIKLAYYKISHYFNSKEKMNRLSFYDIDKHSLMNLCKCADYLNINISGVYQKNTQSFWFPNVIIYKMDIQEYILFNPHHELIYDKLVE